MNNLITTTIAVFICLNGIGASAQDLKPYKTGDKLTSEVIVLGTRGREIFSESTTVVNVDVVASDESYTLKTERGSTTFSRKNHQQLERETDGRKIPTPESQRLAWMPANKDFTKTYQVVQDFQANQNCGGGIGKATYEGLGKAGKFKIQVNGIAKEIDVVEVTLEGKWQAGSCGSGRQAVRILYSSELDQVVENDFRSFLPNGFLNSGRISRTVSIN